MRTHDTTKKAVLITGVAGLIGSRLADWILENFPEYAVVGLDDLSDGYLDNVDPRVKFYLFDAGSPLDDIFYKYDIEYVFHFAARAAESMAGFNRCFFHTNNVVTSANVINHCIKYRVKRLVFASSMSVYGGNTVPFKENQTPLPIDSYGIGKYAVELDLAAAYDQHGLEYSIFRGHSIYGPKQSLWDKYRNVIGIFMRQILDGQPMTIYGEGLQRRAFTFIDDILPALWLCATDSRTKNQTYNFGNDDATTIMDLANLLIEITGHGSITYLPPIYEVHNAYCDHTKVRKELGLECPTSLRNGLIQMWDWAKKQPKREVKVWDRFEITDGLYDMWKR